MNKDWNPEMYLKFDKERTQPSVDLVSRIIKDTPGKIIDIGCGPGNSTQVLVKRWPNSKVVGVDNSPAMIEKAKKDYPGQTWQILDVGKDLIEGKFDIVFSNATIQWVPNHKMLLKKFHNLLSDDGVLAIQIPLFWDMPLGKAIVTIAGDARWASLTKGVTNVFTIHDPCFYYDNLSDLFPAIDLWVTEYIHILDSHLAVLEMIKSTGLKPFLERLVNNPDRALFEKTVIKSIAKDYPLQSDGKVLFPFKRLFFTAKK